LNETAQIPHESRRGWLKNGNLPGDFSKAAFCGAKTRRGTGCRCRAMANGRCRLHGGLSTGPKTAAGIERIRRAVTKHGHYSAAAKAERRYIRELLKGCLSTLAALAPKPNRASFGTAYH
jgi:hypothetical protein